MSTLSARILCALALGMLAAMTLSHGDAWAGSTPDADDSRYLIDDRGRSMRVEFPLHDRLVLDAYGARSSSRSAGHGETAASLGMALHHSFEVSYPDEEIWWRLRHRWFGLRATRTGGEYQLGTTLLSGTYMRHASNSYVVITSADDLRFPTPFDLAFEYDIFDATFDRSSQPLVSAQVAEFAFLLDFLRDSTYRHRLALGPLMSYGIDRLDRPEGLEDEDYRLAHSFVPASGGRLVYGWENRAGRLAIDGRLQCAATAVLIDQEMDWHRLCSAQVKAERVVLAITDRPLSVFIEGALQEAPDRPELGPPLRWSATVGLRLSLPGSSP